MIAAVILAAGESSRMGRPKQLLSYRGRSLIRHVAEVALQSKCRPVWVVLGAGPERIGEELEPLDVLPVENPGWREGVGSSIRGAVQSVQRHRPPVEAVVLLTCDQYRIGREVIDRLCETYRTGRKPIVASEYAGTVGVPALFDATLFPDLLKLQGKVGAKSVILRHEPRLSRVCWPEGAEQLNTPEDYAALLEEPGE